MSNEIMMQISKEHPNLTVELQEQLYLKIINVIAEFEITYAEADVMVKELSNLLKERAMDHKVSKIELSISP